MIDIVGTLIGEYTVLVLVEIVLSVFLNTYIPKILLQWRFLIVAAFGLFVSWLMPPTDVEAYLYSFIISGLVVYKDVLVEEIKIIAKAAKHTDEIRAKEKEKND